MMKVEKRNWIAKEEESKMRPRENSEEDERQGDEVRRMKKEKAQR